MKKRHRRNFSKKPLPSPESTAHVMKVGMVNRNMRRYSPEAIMQICNDAERLRNQLRGYTFLNEPEHHLTEREERLGIHG